MDYFYKNLEIPYEVVVFLLKREVIDKFFNNEEKNSFITFILSKESATKVKKEKIIDAIISYNNAPSKDCDYKLEPEDIEPIVIKNGKFNIELLEDLDSTYYGNDYYFKVFFSNPKLQVGYKLSTFVRRENYTRIISSCRYMTNNKLHGDYYYIDNQSFYQYRPEDNNLLDNLERVKIISTSTKTTKLIPGHKYLLSDRKKVLYLGELNYSRIRTDSSWRHEKYHPFFTHIFNSTTYDNTKISRLYIDLDVISLRSYYGNTSFIDFINTLEGLDISEFVGKWIEYFDCSTESKTYCLIYETDDKFSSGVDLGEFLKNDCSRDDLTSAINSACLNKLKMLISSKSNSRDDYIMNAQGLSTCGISELSEDIKDILGGIIVKPDIDILFKNSLYRLNNDVISKIKNEYSSGKKIWELLKTSNVSSYYLWIMIQLYNQTSSSLAGCLYSGRDSKLDTLIIESKKVNFKS